MVWDTTYAPPILGALRTLFGQITAWTSVLPGSPSTLNNCHFPTSNPGGYQGTPDNLPHVLFVQTSRGGDRYAEGGGSLPRGTIECDIYVPANSSWTAGALENLGDQIIDGLLLLPQVIPFVGTLTRTLADDPDPGEIAVDTASNPNAYRTIRITLPYGYNP
jgi:hypothetical protein